MEPSRNTGLLGQYGALWLALLVAAVTGASWVFGLAGKVANNQDQIAVLQAEVANRRGAMSLIENVQRDVTRLERIQEQLHEELDEREIYKEVVARMEEHIRTLDERVVQVERMLGWRVERGPGAGPESR